MKLAIAQQAKPFNIYKNTRMKLLKANSAIWFNKICKKKGLQPNYISFHTNNRNARDRRTTQQAVKYRINQELKYLYKKKQHLNQLMYKTHLECATVYNGMWQHALANILESQNKLMELTYDKLQQKIHKLEKFTNVEKHKRQYLTQNTQQKVINLSTKQLTNQQLNILEKGPQYAIETEPKQNINNIIAETECAIRHLDFKWQNTYRHIATKAIKRLKTKETQNSLHKLYNRELTILKKELAMDNIKIVKADKTKALVLIHDDLYNEKINNFLTDNNFTQLRKDPTKKFQKDMINITQHCRLIIDNNRSRHLIQMNPSAPNLNALIKTHKEGMPIRPVINNTCAPSHKIARHISKLIQDWQILPNVIMQQIQ